MQLLKGDSLKVLRDLENETVDAVITDPPYASGALNSTAKKSSTGTKYSNSNKYADFEGDCRDQRSLLAWSSQWMAESYRIAKPGAHLLCFIDWRNYPVMADALQVGGWIWRGALVWDKKNCRPRKDGFGQQCEFILWATKGPHKFTANPKYHKSIFNCHPHRGGRFHQTSKPIDVMEWLCSVVPKDGKVLDPFMGSGSTGVACKNLGLDFVGIEMTDVYHEIATQRLAA
jgi:site-specific DNA-methyltransferase (adenine-specific)